MSNYDDWKLADGECKNVFGTCDECEEKIYVGEEYIRLNDGAWLHTEGSCFEYYIEKLLEPNVKVAGE